MKAVYNPKYITVRGAKTINTAHVRNFIWSHARWNLKANEMKKFPNEVAEAMLRHMEFLIEVKHDNIDEIKKMIDEAYFVCQEKECAYKTDDKRAFIAHARGHGKTPEKQKFLEDIESAEPTGSYGMRQVQRRLEPEQQEGIPLGRGRDVDGVEWYGEGTERDTI